MVSSFGDASAAELKRNKREVVFSWRRWCKSAQVKDIRFF